MWFREHRKTDVSNWWNIYGKIPLGNAIVRLIMLFRPGERIHVRFRNVPTCRLISHYEPEFTSISSYTDTISGVNAGLKPFFQLPDQADMLVIGAFLMAVVSPADPQA